MANSVLVTPLEGWEIDDQLAAPFSVDVQEIGVDLGQGIIGWRGVVRSGKYAASKFEMSPRLEDFAGVVVMKVLKANDRDDLLFFGFAETDGLEGWWK